MTYKTRMCYVVMRETDSKCNEDPYAHHCGMDHGDAVPVAVFYDQETAEGNAEGYNLEFKEREIEGIRFYVAITASYD